MRTWLENRVRIRRVKQQNREQIAGAHASVMEQALHPAFYGQDKARDDFFGRFGMVILHGALLMRRLRECGETGNDFAQTLFDALFSGFDDALRETGVGDLGVGKRIKHMGQRFYGAARAYDTALAETAPDSALNDALARNTALPVRRVPDMAAYVRQLAGQLDQQNAEALLQGRIDWPDASIVFPETTESVATQDRTVDSLSNSGI